MGFGLALRGEPFRPSLMRLSSTTQALLGSSCTRFGAAAPEPHLTPPGFKLLDIAFIGAACVVHPRSVVIGEGSVGILQASKFSRMLTSI